MFGQLSRTGRIIRCILLGCVITPGFFVLPIIEVRSQSADLFISEIAHSGTVATDNCRGTSPSFTCNQEKWLEIYNPTLQTVDLTSYILMIGTNNTKRNLSGRIQPLSTFVIADSGQVGSNLVLQTADLRLGALNFISGNTTGAKYVRVGLLKSGQPMHSIDLNNQELIELESTANVPAGSKFSLSFQNTGLRPFVDVKNTYGRISEGRVNYGSPGKFMVINKSDSTQVVETVKTPIVATNPGAKPNIKSPSVQTNNQALNILPRTTPLPNTKPAIATQNTAMQTTNIMSQQQDQNTPEINPLDLRKTLLINIDTARQSFIKQSEYANANFATQRRDSNLESVAASYSRAGQNNLFGLENSIFNNLFNIYHRIFILTFALAYFAYKNLQSIYNNRSVLLLTKSLISTTSNYI